MGKVRISKIEAINSHIDLTYAGISPDFLMLVKYARNLAQIYKLKHGGDIPVMELGAV